MNNAISTAARGQNCRTAYQKSDESRIRGALNHIPADDRETWVRMGMAVKAELGEGGFDLWDDWSRTGESYNESDARAVWRSFKAGGISIATLFKEANAHGYTESPPLRPIDPAERERRRTAREQQRHECEEAAKQRHTYAAERAARIWSAATPSDGGHPYLRAKGIGANGTRVGDWPVLDAETGEVRYTVKGALLLQIRDFDKHVHSVQAIFERTGDDGRREFTKLFLRDGEKRGHFFPIGQPKKGADGHYTFIVAEGFATAASVHEATAHGCVVAFDAGNLAPVCRIIRSRFPDARILIVGDRDAEDHARSTGSCKAADAAVEVGACLFVPEWTGSGRDANDIYQFGFKHEWTDAEGNRQTVDIPGPDHLMGCIGLALAAGPLRPEGFRQMMDWLVGVSEQPVNMEAVPAARAGVAEGDAQSEAFLNKDDPMGSARAMLRLKYFASGTPTLVHEDGEFFRWVGPHYDAVSDDEMSSDAWLFLEGAKTREQDKKTGEFAAFNPNRAKVADVLAAMKAITHDRSGKDGARWLRGTEAAEPREIMPCANGLLHIKTGRLIPPTPDYFCVNSSNAPYDAGAGAPVQWLEFLDQVLHGDAQAIRELQKIFGYMLTQSYEHQKIFLLIGPPRSGKGTVARVLSALVGKGNVVSPSLSSLDGTFGLMPFIAKSLAIFGDARTASMNSVQKGRATEVLLSISGGDSMSINRKNKGFWNGTLPTRMVILSNEIPNLPDSSMALANRFVVVKFKESFLGREDTGLGDRLLSELSGILKWAAQGWEALEQDGLFSTPESAREETDHIKSASSPIAQFVDDCCELGAVHTVNRDSLYMSYLQWCESEGIKQPRTKSWLVRDLRSAFSSLKTGWQGGDVVHGIRLRAAASVEYISQTRGAGQGRAYERF